jgi:hypothetical protein
MMEEFLHRTIDEEDGIQFDVECLTLATQRKGNKIGNSESETKKDASTMQNSTVQMEPRA